MQRNNRKNMNYSFDIKLKAINLHLRNMELNKVCQEKEIVMIMHGIENIFGHLKTELIYQNSYSRKD